MKITIMINEEPVEITLTPEQLATVTQSQTFQLHYSRDCYVLGTANYTPIHTYEYDSAFLPSSIITGTLRRTEEGAKISIARIKRANRIEALAEYLGGLKEYVMGEDNYSIYFGSDLKIYAPESYKYAQDPEKVYMTKDCAIKACELLNSGQYTL